VELEAFIPSEDFGTIWVADPVTDSTSFVICLGWCRKTGDKTPQMSAEDLRYIHREHHNLGIPPLRNLSGTFCLLSYDGPSGVLWVASDAWAVGGYYYGSNAADQAFVISNRAGIVANELGSAFDGISYLAWLRRASIPPTRTLFAGVHRTPMRKAMKVDSRSGHAWLVPWREFPGPDEAWSYQESYQRFKDVLTFCIPKASSDPQTVIDLTSGNDTRMTATALAVAHQTQNAGVPLRFRIVGHDGHRDLGGAQAIVSKMGWDLKQNIPVAMEEIPIPLFAPAAVRGDTAYLFHGTAKRLVHERRYWPDMRFHVGSTGGQLFRNWMWQYEMLNPFRGTRIRYEPLLLHRIHNYPDVDFARVSDGALDKTTHNEWLLEGIRAIDEQAPDLLDLYKLERVHLQTESDSIFWCLSGQLNVILPYLWAEMIDVSLRIPWRHKFTRSLVLDFIRECAPALCSIPTDSGAPFRRLSPSSALDYLKYITKHGMTVLRTHYRPRATGMPTVSSRSLPSEWVEFNRSLAGLGTPYDMAAVLDTVGRKRGQGLTRTEAAEFEVLLHCRLLCLEYPRLRLSLDFTASAGDVSANEHLIFPSV
jgi:hypothetical protein